MPLRLLSAVLLTSLVLACGSADDSTPDTGNAATTPDGGGSGSPDAGDEPTPDAGDEPTPDAGDEETPDAGDEVTPDAGDEQTPDAGDEETPDAGDEETPDAGSDVPTEGGLRVAISANANPAEGVTVKLDGADVTSTFNDLAVGSTGAFHPGADEGALTVAAGSHTLQVTAAWVTPVCVRYQQLACVQTESRRVDLDQTYTFTVVGGKEQTVAAMLRVVRPPPPGPGLPPPSPQGGVSFFNVDTTRVDGETNAVLTLLRGPPNGPGEPPVLAVWYASPTAEPMPFPAPAGVATRLAIPAGAGSYLSLPNANNSPTTYTLPALTAGQNLLVFGPWAYTPPATSGVGVQLPETQR